MNKIKLLLNSFIDSLHIYDYILFGTSAFVFLLLLILAIVLRKKTTLSIILILMSFVTLIGAPIGGYIYIHDTLYKNKISDLKIKRLEFSEALVVKGKVTNYGKERFHKCTISTSVFKKGNNFLQRFVYPLKPIQKMSIVQSKSLDINQSFKFKMILEPFTYSKEYNVSVKAKCL